MRMFLDYALAAVCLLSSGFFIAFLLYEMYMITKDVQEYAESTRRLMDKHINLDDDGLADKRGDSGSADPDRDSRKTEEPQT